MRSVTSMIAAAAVALACPNARGLGDHTIVGTVLRKIEIERNSNSANKFEIGVLVDGKVTISSSSKAGEWHGIVFLSGYPDFEKLFDGSPIKCKCELFDGSPMKFTNGGVLKDGTYEYTDVFGARRTVQAFTFSSLDTN